MLKVIVQIQQGDSVFVWYKNELGASHIRSAEGVDWYDAQASYPDGAYTTDTNGVITSASRDASALFPLDMEVWPWEDDAEPGRVRLADGTIADMADCVLDDAPDGEGTRYRLKSHVEKLAEAITAKRAEVEEKMRAVLAEGCAHDGHRFQCTEADGARVNNAVAAARMAANIGTPFVALTWTTIDNQPYPIKTLAELEALAIAINARITTAFTARNHHKTALMTAAQHTATARDATIKKRIAAVAAYDITEGWA